MGMVSEGLSEKDRKLLLKLARESIINHFDGSFDGRTEDELSDEEYDISPVLKEFRGAFVTLKIGGGNDNHGDLRGCIGHIIPVMPLYRDVMVNAVNSAFHDTRFDSLGEDELGSVVIEISVLSAPKILSVKSFEDYLSKIRIGDDGVIIEMDGCSAVFLPQVPVEQGWDVREYLSELCHKAGPPLDAWMKSDAKVYTFQAEVFCDE